MDGGTDLAHRLSFAQSALEAWVAGRSAHISRIVLLRWGSSSCSQHELEPKGMLPQRPNILVTLRVNLVVSLMSDCPKFRELVKGFHQHTWVPKDSSDWDFWEDLRSILEWIWSPSYSDGLETANFIHLMGPRQTFCHFPGLAWLIVSRGLVPSFIALLVSDHSLDGTPACSSIILILSAVGCRSCCVSLTHPSRSPSNTSEKYSSSQLNGPQLSSCD